MAKRMLFPIIGAKRQFQALLIMLLGLIILGIILGRQYANFQLSSTPAASPTTYITSAISSASPTASPVVVSLPKSLIIPKLGVNAEIERVGQDFAGKMDVPKKVNNVGWYELGYKPGEKGSAVIDGHLDDVSGAPAVFYYIGRLQAGDEIKVISKDNKEYSFKVIKSQTFPFDQVPLQEIFASNDKSRLNLITCTGTWDKGTRNYSNRLVVYAEKVD